MLDKPLEWVAGICLTVIGYFVRDIHVRLDRHLDENQKAHEQMRAAMAEARAEAGRVEERQDALKEQLAEMKDAIKGLRADLSTLPARVAESVSRHVTGRE